MSANPNDEESKEVQQPENEPLGMVDRGSVSENTKGGPGGFFTDPGGGWTFG